MHKNLRRTDDHLLQLKEKLEKEGDREDLEAEVIQLRERIEELEEGEKNQLNEAEFRKQIENEIKARGHTKFIFHFFLKSYELILNFLNRNRTSYDPTFKQSKISKMNLTGFVKQL